MTDNVSFPRLQNMTGGYFTVSTDPQRRITLKLSEVVDKGSNERQERFVLVFTGPVEAPLPQGLYDFAHEHLGVNAWFIVPVGQNQHEYIYEAVFNRFIDKE